MSLDITGIGTAAGAVGQVVSVIGSIIGRFIPDKEKQAEAVQAIQMELLSQMGAENTGQIEINKVEAANPNVFVSGWRPMIGWICALALAWNFFLGPIALFICAICGVSGDRFPDLSSPELMTLTVSLLGVTAARTFEKYNGVEPPTQATTTTKEVRKALPVK